MEYDITYPHWRRVINRLPSLGDLTDSLATLVAVCNDTGNEKWLSKLAASRWLSHVKDVLNAGNLFLCTRQPQLGVPCVLYQLFHF